VIRGNGISIDVVVDLAERRSVGYFYLTFITIYLLLLIICNKNDTETKFLSILT